MAGEVATGLVGRIAALDGHRTHAEVANALRVHCQRHFHPDPSATLVTHLALISELTLEEFVQRHTMMPYLRAVSSRGPGCPHGNKEDLNIVRRLGMILGRDDTQLCPACVLEAKNEFGYSYYRREHQLVGIEWCNRHDRPLLRLPVPMDRTILPHWHLKEAAIASKDAKVHQANPVVRKYSSIARGFLDRKAPVSTSWAAERIRRRAEDMGLSTPTAKVGRNRATIGALARRSVPRSWLRTLMANGQGASVDQVIRALDTRLMSGVSAAIYALAAALVYPTAEAALDDLREPRVRSERARSRRTTQ